MSWFSNTANWWNDNEKGVKNEIRGGLCDLLTAIANLFGYGQKEIQAPSQPMVYKLDPESQKKLDEIYAAYKKPEPEQVKEKSEQVKEKSEQVKEESEQVKEEPTTSVDDFLKDSDKKPEGQEKSAEERELKELDALLEKSEKALEEVDKFAKERELKELDALLEEGDKKLEELEKFAEERKIKEQEAADLDKRVKEQAEEEERTKEILANWKTDGVVHEIEEELEEMGMDEYGVEIIQDPEDEPDKDEPAPRKEISEEAKDPKNREKIKVDLSSLSNPVPGLSPKTNAQKQSDKQPLSKGMGGP